MTKKKGKRNLRLGFRLSRLDTVLIAGVSCLLIFVILFFNLYTYNVRNSEEQLIRLVLERMSANQKTQFEEFVDQKIENLQALTSYPDLYNMDDERIKKLLRGKANRFGFQYFFVMKADGIGFYLDEGEVYRDQKNELFFREIMATDVYLTEPFYTNEGPAITTACVAIRDAVGHKVGVLCGAINLASIQSIIERSELVLDGSCFILNRDGNYISSNTNSDLHSKERVIYQVPNSELSLIKQSFEEKTDMAGEVTIDGVEYMTHLTYLADFDWVIVQNIPMHEVTERFQYIETMQVIMMILVVGLFICIIRIIYSWRRSDRKIYTDALTGNNSRAACINLIEKLEEKKNMRLSVIYMDLNKFKYVNDTYGHDEGDRLLRIFGATLQQIFGARGFVGRMGGDEFVAVLADTSDSEIDAMCAKVDEILREKSQSLPFEYVITASYGYASRNVGRDETLDEIMQMADEKMYKDKAVRKAKEASDTKDR